MLPLIKLLGEVFILASFLTTPATPNPDRAPRDRSPGRY
jgi:hypothetical protein